MKCFSLTAGALALSLLLVGLVRAETPAEREADLVPVAAKTKVKFKNRTKVRPKPKRPPQKKQVHGHSLLSRDRMKSLRNGTHHLRTGRSGHRAHVTLRNGKVAGMKVADRNGRNVLVRRYKQSGADLRRHASQPGGEDVRLVSLAKDVDVVPVSLTVYVVFVYYNPVLHSYTYFFWPVRSCSPSIGGSGGGGGDDGGGDDGGGDDGGGDDTAV